MAVFAVACMASGYTHDLTSMTAWRFVTGLGLGAAMPNAVTLMSEYCPENRRATITNAMFCGFPLGAAFGGFLAAWMIPHFGWRSVLHLGGVAPMLLLVLLVYALGQWLAPDGNLLPYVFGWSEGLLIAWMPVYLLLMQKRVYAQGWPMTLLKYCVLGTCYTILLSVAVLVSIVIGLVAM